MKCVRAVSCRRTRNFNTVFQNSNYFYCCTQTIWILRVIYRDCISNLPSIIIFRDHNFKLCRISTCMQPSPIRQCCSIIFNNRITVRIGSAILAFIGWICQYRMTRCNGLCIIKIILHFTAIHINLVHWFHKIMILFFFRCCILIIIAPIF